MENKKIICIDSDGCVMDTMNYKHILCFGPLAADIFNIKNRKKFLDMWNEINLFSKTRGVNRFKGLSIIFNELSKEDKNIKPLLKLNEFIENSKVLSNEYLEKEIEKTDEEELKKVLFWSLEVNKKIDSLSGMDKPFEGVKEAFLKIKKYSEIAIVSSANKEAIVSEWERHKLLKYVDIVMGQDAGTKKDCIQKLIDSGYKRENILMVGDSPGDLEAARQNNVLFYPIIFDEEKESWNQFENKILELFINGQYIDIKYVEKYNQKLGEKVK